MMRLTTHFTLAEFTASATAQRLGVDNTPDDAALCNLVRLAAELEKVRALTGKPLAIKSGYRSPKVNTAVGGHPRSFHLVGCAADFDPPKGMTHDALQKKIFASRCIDFDLVLEEKAKDGAHWLHFQIAQVGKAPRRKLADAQLDKLGGAITAVTPG